MRKVRKVRDVTDEHLAGAVEFARPEAPPSG
jgi:hypothetical protein